MARLELLPGPRSPHTTQRPAWYPAGWAALPVTPRLSPRSPHPRGDAAGPQQAPPLEWRPGLGRQVDGRTLDPEEEGEGGGQGERQAAHGITQAAH